MSENIIKTEVVVIGSGPGGYVAAIRLGQLNKKVVLVEEDSKLGGICLNHGCIPSKAMIYAAELFDKIKRSSVVGIKVDNASIDFNKLQEWKNSVVSKLNKGIEFLCKGNKVTVAKGKAFFENSTKIRITENNNVSYIEFDKSIIATGSKPIEIPAFKFGGNKILSSTEALKLDAIPDKLVVIGGGYIGLELGSVYAKLGSKVSVIEMTGQILPGFNKSIVDVLQKNLQKSGIEIYLNAKAEKIENNKVIANSKEKGRIELDADKVIVAVGRYPNTKNLGLENTKVKLDEKGFVKVDNSLKTDDNGIYAIGDIST